MRAVLDLHDYDSPIRAVDGTVPYNGYLWPTESWWPGHTKEFRHRMSGGWFHFEIVALADGRFSIDGTVSHIEGNTTVPRWRDEDPAGLPVVFETRSAAIRTGAARMIREMRQAQTWGKVGPMDGYRLDRETLEDVINWTLQQVAKACNEPMARLVRLVPPIVNERKDGALEETGLELLDYINRKDREGMVAK